MVVNRLKNKVLHGPEDARKSQKTANVASQKSRSVTGWHRLKARQRHANSCHRGVTSQLTVPSISRGSLSSCATSSLPPEFVIQVRVIDPSPP